MVIGVYVSRPHGAWSVAARIERVADLPAGESGPALGSAVPALFRGNICSPSSAQEPITRSVKPFSHLVMVRNLAGASKAEKSPFEAGDERFSLFILVKLAASHA